MWHVNPKSPGFHIEKSKIYISVAAAYMKRDFSRLEAISSVLKRDLVGIPKFGRQPSPQPCVLTPVSAIKGLAYLLPLDELLRLWEPQKWMGKRAKRQAHALTVRHDPRTRRFAVQL